MGQFLDDQLKNDNYYYCSERVRFPKTKILEIVLSFFKTENKQRSYLKEIQMLLKRQLNIGQVNKNALRELIGNAFDEFVSMDKVIDVYNQYSDNKIINKDLTFIPDLKLKTEIDKAEAFNFNVNKKDDSLEYYHCSKLVKFPLKEVVQAIYDLYEEKQVISLDINEIYDYLTTKFRVTQFNRGNLAKLLNSNKIVPFSKVKDIYSKVNFSMKTNDKYDFNLLKFIFDTNRKVLANVINSVGKDLIVNILQQGLSSNFNIINALNLYFDENARTLDVQDKRRNRLFDKNNTKLFVDLLTMFNNDEWIEILKDDKQTKDIISMYIEEKNKEQEKEFFKKTIINLLEFINEDNKNARIKYLFPHSISEVLFRQNIEVVEDIVNISKKSVTDCYEQREILINYLKNLQISKQVSLNERFMHLLQLTNKNYKPNSSWDNYVKILETRAKGYTLQGIGDIFGITKERVRQLENKYLQLFNEFFNSKNENIKNVIRAFVKNPLFVEDEDIKFIFSFNPLLFKYFLVNIEVDGLEYLQELNKFYFVDDYDWYKELISFAENMPAQINKNEIENYINEALNILSKNDVIISYDDCYKILMQDYKVLGVVYSKNKLNLGQKFSGILRDYYPNGVNIYDTKFLSDFRNIYAKLYNGEEIKSDHAVTSIISRISMLAGRGIYVVNDRLFMSEELADKIYNYVIESEREIFLTNNLFEIFEEELVAEGINNKYFMQGALKQRIGDKLYFKRDYIGTNKEKTSLYGEIYNLVKNVGRLVTYDELQEAFVGTPVSILMAGVLQEGILNYRSKYIYADALNISEEDKSYLLQSLEMLVADGNIHHTNDILAYIRLTNLKLLDKFYIEDQFALFSLLEYLFNEKFEFKRPFIAQNGVVIENQADRIREFVYSQDQLSIDSMMNFVNDNKLHLYSISEYIDSLDDYVFKNELEIIKIDKTNLNKYNCEAVEQLILRELGNDECIFADKLKFLNLYPKEVEWTPWLIYSALNKFGTDLKAIPSNTQFKFKKTIFARPLIIRKNVPVKNINEYIDYLKNKLQIDDLEFYKYLRTKGLAD